MVLFTGNTQTSMATYQENMFHWCTQLEWCSSFLWTWDFISSHQTFLRHPSLGTEVLWQFLITDNKLLLFKYLTQFSCCQVKSPSIILTVHDFAGELKYSLKYFTVLAASSTKVPLILLETSSSLPPSRSCALSSLSSSHVVWLLVLCLVSLVVADVHNPLHNWQH